MIALSNVFSMSFSIAIRTSIVFSTSFRIAFTFAEATGALVQVNASECERRAAAPLPRVRAASSALHELRRGNGLNAAAAKRRKGRRRRRWVPVENQKGRVENFDDSSSRCAGSSEKERIIVSCSDLSSSRGTGRRKTQKLKNSPGEEIEHAPGPAAKDRGQGLEQARAVRPHIHDELIVRAGPDLVA